MDIPSIAKRTGVKESNVRTIVYKYKVPRIRRQGHRRKFINVSAYIAALRADGFVIEAAMLERSLAEEDQITQ